uniref:Uncharacterized protein n=1 Tax=Chloropicon laureae TaxID=464258 RepID=A0A7S2Z7S4_9CHLO|mmetsp:Transcript_9214/g.23571  ORF Transcript_9214/g.23571 Transcript_9214/m.23571 type:complete len:693 (+) Transcript_9214:113-2191(+)
MGSITIDGKRRARLVFERVSGRKAARQSPPGWVLLGLFIVMACFAFALMAGTRVHGNLPAFSREKTAAYSSGGAPLAMESLRMEKVLLEVGDGDGAAPSSLASRFRSKTLTNLLSPWASAEEGDAGDVGAVRERKLASYLSLRTAQCDEAANGEGWVSVDMTREGRLNTYLYGNHTSTRGAREERYLTMTRCNIEEAGGQSGWDVYRLGPFVGSGGYDWHQAFVHPLPRPPKAKFITGKLTAPVSQSGEILGYPPIYPHHVHMKVNGVEHVLEAHGDTMCAEENGGKACFLHTYPEGYGMPFDGQARSGEVGADYLSLDFLLIDKREFPAPPMIFFKEVAVKWSADETLTPVSTAMTHAKASKGSPFATTMVAQRPSFLWSTAQWLVDGKLVISREDQVPWFHSHKPYFRAMWAFAASPEELGLTGDLLWQVDDQIGGQGARDYDYVWAPDGEDPLTALKRRVNQSVAGWEALRCWMLPEGEDEGFWEGEGGGDVQSRLWGPPALSSLGKGDLGGEKILERVEATDSTAAFPESWHQRWKGNSYDRAGEVRCGPGGWRFKAGDRYTVLSLNGIHEEMADQGIVSLQHNAFFTLYESDNKTDVGPSYEVYGPYTSEETMSYSVSSSWLRPEEGGQWMAGKETFTERYSSGDEWQNATFNICNETQMLSKMDRMFQHEYYDAARVELDAIQNLI